MFRSVLVIAVLVGSTAALARPGSGALPFAHVEARRTSTCACGPVRRSPRFRDRASVYRDRAAFQGGVRSRTLAGGRFESGAPVPVMGTADGFQRWRRYDDCIWGYAGLLPPAHCTDYYAF